MSHKPRTLSLVIALAAVAVFFVVTGLASAQVPVKTTSVCGIVVNHQHNPVDGTRTTPPLVVQAVGGAAPAVQANVDANGQFRFDKLAVGQWDFQMQLPEEWDGLVPVTNEGELAKTGLTNLEERTPANCHKVLFKIRRNITITIIKWEELLNGTVQPGDGWKFTATNIASIPPAPPIPFDPFNNGPQAGVTDVTGTVTFRLTPGAWWIWETLPWNWTNLVPGTPGGAPIQGPAFPGVQVILGQFDPPGARDPVIFKNRECGCKDGKIIVKKFGFGTDADGKEVPLGPLANWTVDVDPVPGGPWPPPQLTNSMGEAIFGGLTPGVYEVWETVKPGWEEKDNKAVQIVILPNCDEPVTVTFNNKEKLTKLRIYGWKTLSAPGTPADGAGLAGWTIVATQPGTGVQVQTVTDATGYYEFTQAQLEQAGMAFFNAVINVNEVLQPGWVQLPAIAFPATGSILLPGALGCQVRFPNTPPPGYAGARCDFVNTQEKDRPDIPPKRDGRKPCWDPKGHGCWIVDPPPPAAGCRATYVVKPGDTLARIASSYRTTVGAIAGANGIKNYNVIRAGQVLCIK